MIDQNDSLNTRYGPMIVGFVISLVLVLILYPLTKGHEFSNLSMITLLLILAAVQAIAQLICFMHLGFEKGPKYGLMLFLFMVLVIVIVVAGSIWIMANIQYNEMLPGEYMSCHSKIEFLANLVV